MRTIEIKLYKFDELSDEAKQHAIKKWIESEQDYNPLEMFFEENCRELCAEKGFNMEKLQYSLNYCQGDGLSFSGTFDKDILADMFAKYIGEQKRKTAKLIADSCEMKITGNTGRYCYASRNDVDLYLDYYKIETPNIDSVIDKVRQDLETKYMELCAELEKIGYAEIEYHYSEEHAKESIESNEHEFTEDGNMY